MKLARKVILHSPISDETLLLGFVETCLNDGVSLLAIVGPGCAQLEEAIDEIVCGDGFGPKRFLSTTSHPDEPLQDVLNMARIWDGGNGAMQEVRL